MPWGGIRILPDDENPDIRHRARERFEHRIACGEVSASGGIFGAEEVARRSDGRLDWRQGRSPVRSHEGFEISWTGCGRLGHGNTVELAEAITVNPELSSARVSLCHVICGCITGWEG